MKVPFFYQSGEQIELSDRVCLHGEPAEIESIHDPLENPHDWYVVTYGGGVMITEPRVFGHLFIDASGLPSYDDLEFVSRTT
jgi:hypothetical protein